MKNDDDFKNTIADLERDVIELAEENEKLKKHHASIEDIEREIKELIKDNPAAAHYEKLYLDGVCLAHSWWTKAKLEGHVSEPAFKRILEGAKARYDELFGKKAA